MFGPTSVAYMVLMLSQLSGVASPANERAVKLWIDTATENACEQTTPASGAWLLRNNENRNVHVILQRSKTKDGATTDDNMRDTLGPHETRELGCEVSDEGRQTLSVVKVTF